ncbi:MAG: hypothetical protein GF398_01745 [Chitinivibrionales bacterium]|nr:hypothetical protein [Chitinivibrionales bacterium]
MLLLLLSLPASRSEALNAYDFLGALRIFSDELKASIETTGSAIIHRDTCFIFLPDPQINRLPNYKICVPFTSATTDCQATILLQSQKARLLDEQKSAKLAIKITSYFRHDDGLLLPMTRRVNVAFERVEYGAGLQRLDLGTELVLRILPRKTEPNVIGGDSSLTNNSDRKFAVNDNEWLTSNLQWAANDMREQGNTGGGRLSSTENAAWGFSETDLDQLVVTEEDEFGFEVVTFEELSIVNQ